MTKSESESESETKLSDQEIIEEARRMFHEKYVGQDQPTLYLKIYKELLKQ